MPLYQTTAELLNAFDNNEQIQTQRLNVTVEHAGQCMVMEMARELKAMFGNDIAAYNNSTQEQWDAAKASAYERTKRHPAAEWETLNAAELEIAAGLGGSYYEHTHQYIMSLTGAEDKIFFRRQG